MGQVHSHTDKIRADLWVSKITASNNECISKKVSRHDFE